MKIFKSKHKLQKEILNIKNISFVPTMGGLHKGHESLIKKSKKYGCKSLVTIFVNPKQFDKKEDFQSYPRNIKKDIQVLKSLNVDFIYLPKIKDIFSFRTKNEVFLDQFSKKLCGKSRKGHFEGVLNVVNRLLEIIKPKYMLLGNKDFQQLHLLDKHIKRRKIITKIISCKTIREINDSLGEKAEITSTLIRGEKYNPLNNYVHLNVLPDGTESSVVSADAKLIEAYNKSRRPSTKAKNLIEKQMKMGNLIRD